MVITYLMMYGRYRLLQFCLVVIFVTVQVNAVSSTDNSNDENNAISQSYISKHSSAWRSFAIANDIEKREKLKKALRDALTSVDSRKSDIITASASEVESSTSRIKHAASLLKEFQQIHKLSETVKRTLVNYQVAKSNLSKTINSDSGIGILKRFLVGRSKRTFVPRAQDKFGDVRTVTKDLELNYLSHTDKKSVITLPLNNTSEVGVDAREKKALRAAEILLKYVGNKKLSKDKRIDKQIVAKLRKDIEGISPDNNDRSFEKTKKSLLAANKASLFIFKDEDKKPLHAAATKKHVVISGEKTVTAKSAVTTGKTQLLHTKEDVQKAQNVTKKSETNSDTDKLKEEVKEEKKPVSRDATGKVEDDSRQADLLESTLKQKETLRTLKEAKLARQKYEIARHELAVKVKELYKMANQYEKDETDNQVLEIKNDHIPKANTNRSSNVEDNVNVPHTKRDDAHPGMALSGVSKHVIKGISTGNTGDNGEHKSFTMGAIDKKEHQISVDAEKEKASLVAKLFSPAPSKHKALDIGVPSNIKLDELKDEVGKNMKTEEQSLKVIAQAIKDDMKDIAKVDKKKKVIQEAVSANRGEIKGSKEPNDKIDEYLTKALTDIMGNEAVAGSDAGKQAEEKQKEHVEENKNTNEDNMKIVAEAMKTAKNPNLPLPLVSSNGDKISLKNKNPEDAGKTRDSKDVLEHVSDHKTPPLDINDPSNKALMDKAIHLEEQVAAQQDKLYSGQNTQIDTPGKPNVAVTPVESKVTTSAVAPPPGPATKGDAYGSIKETVDNPSERQRLKDDQRQEEEEGDDDEEDDDEEDDRHSRRHHANHPHEDDDDDDYDDEDDYDDNDKREHDNRYHDDDAEKRSFKDKPIKPAAAAKKEESVKITGGAAHYDALEDN